MKRATALTVVAGISILALCGGPTSAVGQTTSAQPTPTPTPAPAPSTGKPTHRPCREARLARLGLLDATRRELYETLCGASLWLDGRFGQSGSLETAKQVNGRAYPSVLWSNLQGTKVKTGLDVNVTLPQWEHRLHAFLGRIEPQDYVRDRQEGFGLRSQFVSLETQEKWLGGLGYSLPGATGEHLSFRAGVAGGIHGALFGQAVYRQTIYAGEARVLRLREVGFWRGRDGFGFTSSADWDHVLGKTLLLRWGTIGTVSERLHGLDWRSALVLYQNLHGTRAMAYEAFVSGVTPATGLTEYGGRLSYRQSILRSWFYLDALVGYSWMRLKPGMPLRGTTTVGLGSELWFGPGTE